MLDQRERIDEAKMQETKALAIFYFYRYLQKPTGDGTETQFLKIKSLVSGLAAREDQNQGRRCDC